MKVAQQKKPSPQKSQQLTPAHHLSQVAQSKLRMTPQRLNMTPQHTPLPPQHAPLTPQHVHMSPPPVRNHHELSPQNNMNHINSDQDEHDDEMTDEEQYQEVGSLLTGI